MFIPAGRLLRFARNDNKGCHCEEHSDEAISRSSLRTSIVIPAKAGTHPSAAQPTDKWIPAFAGMTNLGAPA